MLMTESWVEYVVPDRDTAAVEAECRKVMAAHAAIKPRGYDSRGKREKLHRRVDQLLDEHADLREIEAL